MKRFLNNIKFNIQLSIFTQCLRYVDYFRRKNGIRERGFIVIKETQPILIQYRTQYTQHEVNERPVTKDIIHDDVMKGIIETIAPHIDIDVQCSESSLSGIHVNASLRILKTVK